MTPHDLIAAFEKVAEAPDGVKYLRELVLHLSVRGKLVPQDPEDEPASVLLDRVAAEKARLYKAKKIKKPKILPVADAPFEVPNSWKWVAFGTITDARLGKMLDKAKNSGPLRPYLRNANLQWFRFELGDLKELRLEDAQLEDCTVRAGDLVICEGGEPGRSAVCDASVEGMVYQKALHRARPYCGISPWYLAYLLRCDSWSGRLAEKFTGATIKHLTGRSLASYVVPLPPLAEQHRIVARVDALMGLLDRLEAARTARDATRQAARDAILAALSEADSAEDIEIAWTRFTKRMDDLVRHPDDIAPIRQAVLQLAVRGKLVTQDPADEPASALLERVAAERTRITNEKRVRKSRVVPPVEGAFKLQPGWEWASLDSLVSPDRHISYGVLVPGPHVEGGVPLVRVKELHPESPPIRPAKSIGESVAAKYDRVRLNGDELLLGVVGSIGKVGIARTEWKGAVVARAVVRMGIAESIPTRFVLHVLQSPLAQDYFRNATRTLAQPTLNVTLIRQLPVPVPPLTEQHRIVARLDRLVGLLDRLEQRLQAATEAQIAFAAAAVHHLDVGT